MSAIFYAIYDDSATTIPFKMIHRSPYTVYRTSKTGLIEEVSALGLEPKAVLLEEDIESLRKGEYTNDEVSGEEMEFLAATVTIWSWDPNNPPQFLS